MRRLILNAKFADPVTGIESNALPENVEFYWTAFGSNSPPDSATELEFQEFTRREEAAAVERAVEKLTNPELWGEDQVQL